MKRNYDRDSRIRLAIDECLSGVEAPPTLQHRVLQQIRGEKKMKPIRRFTPAAALALLVLLCCAVIALSLPGGTLDTTTLAQPDPPPPATAVPDDPLDRWSDEDVLRLCQLLALSGRMTELTENDAPQARAMLHILYADEEAGSVRGDAFWAYDMKALECQLQRHHGAFRPDWEEYLLPQAGDLSRDDAYAAALDLLYDRFTLPLEFPGNPLDEAFVLTPGAVEPVWRFRWQTADGCYEATLSRTGEPRGWTTPYTPIVYAPGVDPFADAQVVAPGEGMCTAEEVISRTRESAAEVGYYTRDGNSGGLEYADVERADATARLLLHEHLNYGLEPAWVVEFRLDGALLCRVLRRADGGYISTAFGDMDFSDTVANGIRKPE